jgi:hypothetical protein
MGYAWTLEDFLLMERFKNFQSKRIFCYANTRSLVSALESFSLVGVFEDIDKTIGFLVRDLGLTAELYRDNKRSYSMPLRKSDLTERHLRIARENNEIDILLYDEAATRLKSLDSPNVPLTKINSVPTKVRAKQKAFNIFARIHQGVFWDYSKS